MMDDPETAARETAATALGHDVPLGLPAEDGHPIVALSRAGDPPSARVAWVEPDTGAIVARMACPPGVPSRARPLVACVADLEAPGHRHDRLIVARVAPEAAAIQALLSEPDRPDPAPVGPEGLAVQRIAPDANVMAVDALDASGEPIGRLIRGGLAILATSGQGVSGRLGAGHGMAAGIGDGRWVESAEEAAFEAGFAFREPGWVPRGMTPSRYRVEPDVSYPSAPPGLIRTWTGEGEGRVLIRQVVAPLASPPSPGRLSKVVDVNGVPGVLGGRWMGTLVWQTEEIAFGVQVQRMPWPAEVAQRVARSLGETGEGGAPT